MLTSGEIALIVAFFTLLGGVITAWFAFRGKLAEVGGKHRELTVQQEADREESAIEYARMLREENRDLKAEVKAIEEQNALLRTQNNEVILQNGALRSERDVLTVEVQALRAEVGRLGRDVVRLTGEISDLKDGNQSGGSTRGLPRFKGGKQDD